MTKGYPISQRSLTDLETNMVLEAVQSGWVSSMGKFLALFESKHPVVDPTGIMAAHLASKPPKLELMTGITDICQWFLKNITDGETKKVCG